MRAVDTNVLVRLLTRDDAAQAAAAEAYVSAGAWISHLALAETLWVLADVYGASRERCARTVELLLTHEAVTLQEPEVVLRALERFRERSGPDFADCLLVEIARRAGHSPLGTFDRALARSEGVELVR